MGLVIQVDLSERFQGNNIHGSGRITFLVKTEETGKWPEEFIYSIPH
ncbi:hypothetical protein SAMN05660836_00471 [Thermodesulforhabdus norvegica]|uniref:Uncharacterized protein n=1 Tax=Thermodesulforhabdus norvegica TaxID=39841 RepID=A0A1I4R8G3_9BACT|nr:hypothetical protein SAMN05660836_00471 [Thermodesulforhabdus norvegica]